MKYPLPLAAKLLLLSVCCTYFSNGFAQTDSLHRSITVRYEQTHFNEQFASDWRLTSVEYGQRFAFGTAVARVSEASRFARHGWQFEGEAYPVISKHVYAYTGVSYSPGSPVFPKWRTGSSLYVNLSQGWEAEGGFRFLFFDQSIWMGTAGVSKYLGSWLLNARSFFSLRSPANNRSLFLKASRYWKAEKNVGWVQIGSGISPDEARNVQLAAEQRLVSKRINAGVKLSLSKHVQLDISAGLSRDEYRTKTYGNQYNGSVGAGYRF